MNAQDLPVPCIINHHTFLGNMQLKRVESVEFDATTHPNVLKTLGVDDSRPIMEMRGDTVDIDNQPVGTIRGWKTYINTDEPVEVVKVL